MGSLGKLIIFRTPGNFDQKLKLYMSVLSYIDSFLNEQNIIG